jgi:serine protease
MYGNRPSFTGLLAGIIGSFISLFFKFLGTIIGRACSWQTALFAMVVLVGIYLYNWWSQPEQLVVTLPESEVIAFQPACSEIVVNFEDSTSVFDIEGLDAQLPGAFRATAGGAYGLFTIPSSDCQYDLQVIRTSAFVESADVQGVATTTGLLPDFQSWPNDPLYSRQWHMDMINAPYAWEHTKRGKGIVVAVLDTGVQAGEDLDPARLLAGKTFAGGKVDVDPVGHGTHVAGTIGQWTNNGKGVTGVAPDVTILPVKVLSDQGSGAYDWIAAGIYYAIEQKADVINMSLGGTASNDVLRQAVEDADKAGVIVVAAAGNSNTDRPHYPSGYPTVISVSAVGPEGRRAPYSNFGSSVDIAAPGGDTSTHGDAGGVWQEACPAARGRSGCGYYPFQGTSMASPHVAGVVAVLLGEGLEHNRASVMEALSTREDHHRDFGYGVVDLQTSLKRVQTGGCHAY